MHEKAPISIFIRTKRNTTRRIGFVLQNPHRINTIEQCLF